MSFKDLETPANPPMDSLAPSLKQLYFYLTEGCNLACRHCWLAPKFDPDGRYHSVLALEHFECAIREAKFLGLQQVKLTGGEPLLHPEFLKLVEVVKREELGMVVETNGVLMTKEIAEAIAAVPRRFVSVSLDGVDAATHEWVRGVEGCYEASLHGIRDLVREGVHPQIIMSLFRENVDQIEALVSLAEDLKASSVKFNVIQPTARGQRMHESEATLVVDEYIELGRWVDKQLAEQTQVRLYFDYPLAFRPLSSIAMGNGCGICGIFNILGVLSSGHYALCGIGTHLPELVFGEVGIDALANVWLDNPKLNELRARLPNDLTGICSDCLMNLQCLGSCVAQNAYHSGDLLAPFWFCQEAFEAGLFPPSRQKLSVTQEQSIPIHSSVWRSL